LQNSGNNTDADGRVPFLDTRNRRSGRGCPFCHDFHGQLSAQPRIPNVFSELSKRSSGRWWRTMWRRHNDIFLLLYSKTK